MCSSSQHQPPTSRSGTGPWLVALSLLPSTMESESERRSLLFSPDVDEDNAPLDESDLLLAQERRRGWLKVDIALLPIVTSMLLISLLDRSNIGNALVAGLKTDLELSDSSVGPFMLNVRELDG